MHKWAGTCVHAHIYVHSTDCVLTWPQLRSCSLKPQSRPQCVVLILQSKHDQLTWQVWLLREREKTCRLCSWRQKSGIKPSLGRTAESFKKWFMTGRILQRAVNQCHHYEMCYNSPGHHCALITAIMSLVTSACLTPHALSITARAFIVCVCVCVFKCMCAGCLSVTTS